MSRNVTGTWIAGLVLAIATLSATAATVTLDQNDVVRDGYVNQGGGSFNAGNILGHHAPPNSYHGLVRFDLSGVSGSCNSATLRLYWYAWNGDYSVDVFQIEDGAPAGTGVNDWTAGATYATYDGSNPWDDVDQAGAGDGTLTGARLQSTLTTLSVTNGQPAGYMEFDVTGAVRNWLQGGHPNYGFVVKGYTGAGPIFYGQEEASKGPELVIDLWEGGDYTLHASDVVYDGYFDRGLQPGFYNNQNILTYDPGGTRIQDGLIKFDVSTLPDFVLCIGATLRLYRFGNDADYSVNVWQIEDGGNGTNDWTSSATWTTYDGVNAWADVDEDPYARDGDVQGARLDNTQTTQSITNGQPLGYLEWDVTAAALNWLHNGHPNYGFLLGSHEDYSGWTFGGTFYDSEPASNPGLGPELVLNLWKSGPGTYTPPVLVSGWAGAHSGGSEESNLNKPGEERLLLETSPSKRCGLVKFDLGPVPSLSQVKLVSATLHMTAYLNSYAGSVDVDVDRIGGDNDWDTTASWSYQSRSPSDVTWKDPDTGLDDNLFGINVGTPAVLTIPDDSTWGGSSYTTSADVTDIVRAWMNGGDPNYGLRFKCVGGGINILFYGHLAAVTEDLKPRLEIVIDSYKRGSLILIK